MSLWGIDLLLPWIRARVFASDRDGVVRGEEGGLPLILALLLTPRLRRASGELVEPASPDSTRASTLVRFVRLPADVLVA